MRYRVFAQVKNRVWKITDFRLVQVLKFRPHPPLPTKNVREDLSPEAKSKGGPHTSGSIELFSDGDHLNTSLVSPG